MFYVVELYVDLCVVVEYLGWFGLVGVGDCLVEVVCVGWIGGVVLWWGWWGW